MPTNDFVTFAGAAGANVEAEAAYIADTQTAQGVSSGTARSAVFNKAMRQASVIASMVAQFTADHSGANSVDDGTITTLEANFLRALLTVAQPSLGFTPVQQGTGAGQLANAIKIGWSAATKPKMTVDATDLGNIAMEQWVSSGFQPAGNYQSAGNYQAALGFTPVQQGGGFNQMPNRLRMGWDGASKPLLTVDNVDQGGIALESWVKGLTVSAAASTGTGNNAGVVGYVGLTTPIGRVYLQSFRNVTSTVNAAGQAIYNIVFPVAFATTVLGYSWVASDEANLFFGGIAMAGQVTTTAMNVSYSRPNAVTGSSCAISGFVFGY